MFGESIWGKILGTVGIVVVLWFIFSIWVQVRQGLYLLVSLSQRHRKLEKAVSDVAEAQQDTMKAVKRVATAQEKAGGKDG